MKQIVTLIALALPMLWAVETIGQENDQQDSNSENENEKVWRPKLGIGAGVLTFRGDVSRGVSSNRPSTSRPAFNLSFRQNIDDAFDVEITGWTGVISSNERSLESNRNFQSRLFGAGIHFNYNFDHLLKKDRIIEPFAGVGFEYFEFNSKTDLYDSEGRRYHYWDDGTIRDLPQSPANQEVAQRLQRNYDYETDLREMNRDELGLYNNFSFAVPVTGGVNLNISKGWDLRLMARYHFTFTNYIDGVTENSTGPGEANSSNDRFLYLGAQTTFNLNRQTERKKPEPEPVRKIDDTPFSLNLYADSDRDGVADIFDECPGTPEGVEVDPDGCPIDSDGDGVPDYLDKEPNSPPNSIVDEDGVALTGDELAEYYKRINDQSGTYSPIEQEVHVVNISGAKRKRKRDMMDKTYAVKIGEFEETIPNDLINAVLSLPDVETIEKDGKVILALGKFKNITQASQKRGELKQQGINTDGIISRDQLGSVADIGRFGDLADDDDSGSDRKTSTGTTDFDDDDEFVKSREGKRVSKNKQVYRIQLGAFSKKPDMNKFNDLLNAISFKSSDGKVRVYAGQYETYQQAAAAKIDFLQKGYSGAYVVHMRGGDKVDPAKGVYMDYKELPANRKLNENEKKDLKFRVQLGSFKSSVHTATLEKYMDLPDVDQQPGKDGATKFVAGLFDTYQEANQFKKQLQSKGHSGVFVVGQWRGVIIPARKALEVVE